MLRNNASEPDIMQHSLLGEPNKQVAILQHFGQLGNPKVVHSSPLVGRLKVLNSRLLVGQFPQPVVWIPFLPCLCPCFNLTQSTAVSTTNKEPELQCTI